MHEAMARIIQDGLAKLDAHRIEAQHITDQCKARIDAAVELAEGVPEKFLDKFITVAVGDSKVRTEIDQINIDVRGYGDRESFNPQLHEIIGSFKKIQPGHYRLIVMLEKLPAGESS